MIRAQVSADGVGLLELEGTTSEIAVNAATLVRVLYTALHNQSPKAGEGFRRAFKRVEEKGELWALSPVEKHHVPRRPGPDIPVQ